MDEMSMFSQPFSGIVYATVGHFDLDKESRNYVTIRWFVHFWEQTFLNPEIIVFPNFIVRGWSLLVRAVIASLASIIFAFGKDYVTKTQSARSLFQITTMKLLHFSFDQ